MSDSMPSCYRIYSYWRGKGITESGEISDTDGRVVVENEYLPSCWACGLPVNKRDILSWEKYDREVDEIWKDTRLNSRLQRCHVIARQFGGTNEPGNLFLMCENCHAESPDTRNKSAFFRWVYRRRSEYSYGHPIGKMLDDAVCEIRSRGHDPVEFARNLRGLSTREIMDVVDTGLEGCGLHGTTIADASVVVAVIDALERAAQGAAA